MNGKENVDTSAKKYKEEHQIKSNQIKSKKKKKCKTPRQERTHLDGSVLAQQVVQLVEGDSAVMIAVQLVLRGFTLRRRR